MTQLTDALKLFDLDAEIALCGRWATLRHMACRAFVVAAGVGGGYYCWCETPSGRAVERYDNAEAAIRAVLRRAAESGEAA